jgi:hypothetical protein
MKHPESIDDEILKFPKDKSLWKEIAPLIIDNGDNYSGPTTRCGPWSAMTNAEAFQKLHDEFHIIDAMIAACVLDELRQQEQEEYRNRQQTEAIIGDVEDKVGAGWLEEIIKKGTDLEKIEKLDNETYNNFQKRKYSEIKKDMFEKKYADTKINPDFYKKSCIDSYKKPYTISDWTDDYF